jgi:hypothetical protein
MFNLSGITRSVELHTLQESARNWMALYLMAETDHINLHV